MTTQKTGAFARYGVPLAEAGYEVIWIPKGQKGPKESHWQSMQTDVQTVREHAANGKADFNVGIRTRYTPAIDLDILDDELAEELEQWCIDNLGAAPVRVGQAPKRLLVYATDKPQKKRKITFEDANGVNNAIEILGDGQQFVAYGIHPGTKKPYHWTSAKDLTKFETLDLTLLDWGQVDALFAFFRSKAREMGWKLVSDSAGTRPDRRQTASEGEGSYGDIGDTQTRGRFTHSELQGYLALLDPDEGGYERWLQVGQALHSATEGSDEGLKLWDEWSVASADYDSDEIEAKWPSFGVGGHSQMITGRTLAKWAGERREVEEAKTYEQIVTDIADCESVNTLTTSTLREIAKHIASPALHDALLTTIAKRTKSLGSAVSIATIRNLLKKEVRKTKHTEESVLPDWCEDYIFVKQDNMFFSTDTRLKCDKEGFNAEFNRKIPRGEDPVVASKVVLDEYGMRVVDSYTYMPGHPLFVNSSGVRYVNLYNDRSVPTCPKALNEDQKHAVELVKGHFKLLFPDDRERKLLMSYFAYIVQNLDKRVRWAPLIYGAQGAGKTFFHQMMTNVLGKENTMSVNSRQLKQQFTSWAEGNKLVSFEEIRVKGENRFELMDALKPFITNDDVDVRRMHTDIYKVPNVTCFLLFTNHADAIPVQDSDRRWLILATSILSAKQMKDFNEANPEYFVNLFAAIKDHAGAILKWLKQYKLHPEFKADGNAAETDAKNLMRDVSRAEAFDDLEELLNQGPQWDICNELVCIHSLKRYTQETSPTMGMDNLDDDGMDATPRGIILPNEKMTHNLLEQLGFHAIGKARKEPGLTKKGSSGPQRMFYTKYPELFTRKNLQDEVSRRRNSGTTRTVEEDEFGL